MKMIYKTLAVTLLLIVNACSAPENDLNAEGEKSVENQTKSQEEAVLFIEEMHYASIVQEYGEDHEFAEFYRNQFDEIAAGPGKGCPPPNPCGNEGGIIANCLMAEFDLLNRVRSFNPMEDFAFGIYNTEGEPMNALSGSMLVKCPGKKSLVHDFEEPLEGSGYFEVRFYSDIFETEVSFQMPFNQ